MSDYRAISAMSRSLRTLLRDRMDNPVDVTIAPPDASITGMTDVRLNLYVYQVSENGYLKNQDIPGRTHPGAFGHPPLSLDLYYLLTAYGGSETESDSDLRAQEILGDAMRVLHDFPVVADELQISRPAVGTVGDPILDARLLGEFEQVKITQQPVTLEDLSKLWTALPKANFRRSVAYHVCVVQIESQRPRRYPRLVAEPPPSGPRVYVGPFRSPQISELRVIRQGDLSREERPFPYARIGDTLVILGRNFASGATRVTLGSLSVTVPNHSLSDDRIEVTIPDDAMLQPGPQPVKVILDMMMGEPPEPHAGFHSNTAVFMLVPQITQHDTATVPGTLIIMGTRLYREGLDCLTLMGDRVVRSDDYTFKTYTEIRISIARFASGDYPVRVRVNGAESINSIVLNIP